MIGYQHERLHVDATKCTLVYLPVLLSYLLTFTFACPAGDLPPRDETRPQHLLFYPNTLSK
jgi:hypothetical protein